MATTEHTINDALAEILMQTRSLWRLVLASLKPKILMF